ncbi:pilus assembly protein PilE [Betaproteobacteria bacterium]|nr:pilus assembly protein PilE [Betaproteobacteria bacterium]
MQKNRQGCKMNRQQGFTLIELMIVVAIIAILSLIAFPSYRTYVQKTKRAECQGVMMAASGALERYYAVTMKYNGATGLPERCPVDADESSASYKLKYENPAVSGTAVPYFIITAEPQGSQADPNGDKCKTLTLNYQGIKGQDNGNPLTDPACWK